VRRDGDLARAPGAHDLVEHHRPVGEERPARLRHPLDVLQRLRLAALEDGEEIGALARIDDVAVHGA
jgi:hypothetical protein